MRRAVPAVALAIGLGGGPQALALDLPKEALAPTSEPCPGQPGFVRLPGTRSCTRLSGRVTAGADVRAGVVGRAAAPVIAGRVAIDNRTATDYGEVRTFIRLGNGRR
jgi:hypothetical protein